MKISPKVAWLAGFTAVFAAVIGFIFWGTWSPDFAPVMPDNPITHSPYWLDGWWRSFWTSGKLTPADLLTLLGGPYVWQELKYAVSLYFAALGFAYFGRGRGLSYLASFGGGLLLAFCGYWATLFSAGHYGWFQWMTYGIWPFGLIDRALAGDKARHWLLLGATIAWGSCWQPDLWLLFTCFTAAYFVFRCAVQRKFPWKGALMAGLVFLLIGGASIRSAFVNDLAGRDQQIEQGETISQENQTSVDEREKRWIFVTNWSLPPEETLEFIAPRVNGDTSCPFTLSIGARCGTGVRQYTGALGRPKDAPSGNYRQHSLYVGFFTVLLALVGVAGVFLRTKTRRADLIFFAVAAIVFWLFSLGRYCELVYRVIFSLPFGDYLRAPVKWHHLTEFCLCVLAGFGIEGLCGIGGGKKWLRAVVGLLVFIGVCDLARIDRLYCAPVDVREARRNGCNQQMAFLRRSDFNNPQIAEMVRAKRIIALAQPNPDTYLVGVLERCKRGTSPLPPMSAATYLGLLSVLASLGVLALAAKN